MQAGGPSFHSTVINIEISTSSFDRPAKNASTLAPPNTANFLQVLVVLSPGDKTGLLLS